jgi:type IV pilus assembly protein PilA
VSTDPYPTAAPRRGMAIASLVLGILSLPTFGCLLFGAVAGIVLGVMALMRANREPAVYGGKGMAIGGIVTSALSLLIVIPIGIVAAIAIPSLLRARVSANESVTLGDIRSLISAEAAYQSANGGYYGAMECLPRPGDCISGYAGPTFLDPQLASATTKNGYRRTFHGAPSTAADAPPHALDSFAYVAVPDTLGKTGVRGFCGDSSGRICFTNDGSAPEVTGGACAPGCQDLR